MEAPEDIREKAKAVRDKLCIESECTFDRGCGCLNALTQALLSERLAQKERDAKIAEERHAAWADCVEKRAAPPFQLSTMRERSCAMEAEFIADAIRKQP